MFDFRYHVASLAAVFIALVIGILVGVAIAGTGFVKARERELLLNRIDALERQLDRADDRVGRLEDDQRAAQAFADAAYPLVMEGRLRDMRVAVVFIGPVDARTRASVDRVLRDAGAVRIRLRALDVPLEPKLEAIESALAARPALADYAGEDNLGRVGRDLAEEFVAGGQTPLWDALSDELVQERSGSRGREADAVVVVRSAEPQRGPTARFLNGFYTGLDGSATAVGVETSTAATSAVDVFRRAGLSSVDDVDETTGRVALAVLLAGGRPGHYGVKDGADGVLPPLEPVPPSPAGG
jgi:hypothetical protein